jgi:hypothetical protein
MVLSQCCDLELRNRKLVALAFIIAPLFEIPKSTVAEADKYAALKQNIPTEHTSYFYVEAQPPLPTEYRVDFARVASIPNTEYDVALKNKVLQLSDEMRIRLKLKLSHYGGRPTPEELAAGVFERVRLQVEAEVKERAGAPPALEPPRDAQPGDAGGSSK